MILDFHKYVLVEKKSERSDNFFDCYDEELPLNLIKE